MCDNKELRKALDTIALNHSKGVVSNDILIKACENYKEQVGFEEDFDYDMIVAKSVFDAINGMPQDAEICKAVLPGQTKIVDGVMYMYVATPNAQTQYDWRVVRKGKKGTKPVGRSGKLTDKEVSDSEKLVNELFPKDISALKTIKKLGGSTGAELVEDAQGNQYVKKRGTNTNNEHVKAEYLSNQLYSALGLKTPDYELYEENGEQILLSRFIPMTRVPNAKDYAEMSKGFIADCLLANWDVYQNDNCLIDAAGRGIRVDNGGCLNFRAQGKNKTYNDDVLKTFKDMVHYNSAVYKNLDPKDILQQIQDVKVKKDDIINFLLESNEDKLAKIVEQRINNLSKVEAEIQRRLKNFAPNPNPRKVLPEAQMYREFTEQELKDFWDNATGSNPDDKLRNLGSEGWSLLATICKARGFNARPRVVDDATYWKYVSNLPKNLPMMFRGEQDDCKIGTDAEIFAHDFRHSDNCFFGSAAAHGQGIYAHCNDAPTAHDNTSKGYKSSDAWKHAKQYAKSGAYDQSINLLAYETDVKIATQDELIKMAAAEDVGQTDTAKLEKEANKIKDEIKSKQNTLDNITDITRKQVYSDLHYDESSVADMLTTIDDITDWGAVDDDGNPNFPKFDTIVQGEFTKWVTANGGKIVQAHGQLTFSLPNSQEKITLHQYQFDMPNSIRRASPMLPAYHFYARKFKEWFMREHIQRVEKEVQRAIDNIDDKVEKLKNEIKTLSDKYTTKLKEIQDKKTIDPSKSIMHAIYNDVVINHRPQALGIYAAIKGFDGYYKPNGNGSSNGFAIILNRSKLVVKEM